MSDLVIDALPSSEKQEFENVKFEDIDEKILAEIENDLEDYEKISIAFLMSVDRDYALRILEQLEQPQIFDGILFKIIPRIFRWKEKFLESLCVAGMKNVILDLGLSPEEFEIRYSPNITSVTVNINVWAKILYKFFESLDNNQSQLLRKLIYEEIPMITPLQDVKILEYHAFYWIQHGYISIYPDGSCNLKNIFKHLKKMGLSEKPIYLEIEKNSSESINYPNRMDTPQNSINNIEIQRDSKESDDKKMIKNAYVLIINEVFFFPHSKYENRLSSDVDAKRLEETFSKMGYMVVRYNNQTEKEIFKIFDDLPSNVNSKYDSIIVCLLSHGYKDGFISSDSKDIPIEAIERRMCCQAFQNILKILVVQACRGKNKGRAMTGTDHLSADGNNGPSHEVGQIEYVIKYSEFYEFMSTMDNFVSIRDKREGSWFIKACCNVLQDAMDKGKEISIDKWSKEVKRNVLAQQGALTKDLIASQLPEVKRDRVQYEYIFSVNRE